MTESRPIYLKGRAMQEGQERLKKSPSLFQAIKKRVTGAVGSAIAAPAILKSKRMQRQSKEDFDAIRADRSSGGNTPEPYNESNPAFRTRMNAIGARFRTQRRAMSYQ